MKLRQVECALFTQNIKPYTSPSAYFFNDDPPCHIVSTYDSLEILCLFLYRKDVPVELRKIIMKYFGNYFIDIGYNFIARARENDSSWNERKNIQDDVISRLTDFNTWKSIYHTPVVRIRNQEFRMKSDDISEEEALNMGFVYDPRPFYKVFQGYDWHIPKTQFDFRVLYRTMVHMFCKDIRYPEMDNQLLTDLYDEDVALYGHEPPPKEEKENEDEGNDDEEEEEDDVSINSNRYIHDDEYEESMCDRCCIICVDIGKLHICANCYKEELANGFDFSKYNK
jgi:hypothetical protein